MCLMVCGKQDDMYSQTQGHNLSYDHRPGAYARQAQGYCGIVLCTKMHLNTGTQFMVHIFTTHV